jgi:hypothetical protein
MPSIFGTTKHLFGGAALLCAALALLLSVATGDKYISLMVIAIFALAMIGVTYRTRYLVLTTLGQRESLSDDEWYSRFYSQTGIPKADLDKGLQEIATRLAVPKSQIRPTDDLKWLGATHLIDDGLDELCKSALSHAQRRNKHIDPRRIVTVDDYIRTLI